jgi:hypothetical protein
MRIDDHPTPRTLAMMGAVALAAFAFGATTGVAKAGGSQQQPWCATFSGDYGLVDCSYATFAQCHATVFGPGGYCSQNPRVVVLDETLPPRPRHRRVVR